MTRLPMLALPLLALAAPAAAQRPAGAPPPEAARDPRSPPVSTIMAEPVALLIAASDGDGDARVTPAELDAGLARSFAATAGSASATMGYIQFADWAERWLGDRNALPSPFDVDTDQDNRITLAELRGEFARLFARFDKNKDGAIARSELLTLGGGFGPPRGGPGGPGGPPGGDRRGRGDQR